ncbi:MULTISPECIES: hypothetical protein [Cyanophyceae]|uniref:hypothetical protein n=1 Tax=Cyanophyceae TaxID=3028117 RepID=UPI00232CB899|nr:MULTISPECIES: hypothetical protein [Cyanophyceae]MDB9356987.1 hypothetical protein [Nodularia spumigena CS-587/03]MDB9303259.1 hypothetical protein [Nodularia spumigena CS-591/12]MDB9319297.1 hypothetical protein [Nodularia spumigena CS-590/01A]MDB9324319.1 hypothetical protein [Nodularia spumigena CS-591/07A]MDB9326035.1 hypothetical protein [Nodularia spumigena CS-590/02]
MLQKSLLNFLILPFSLVPWLCVGMLFDSKAQALPGQTTEEVTTWIKAHPTLRPRPGERLFIQKSDTAAQRFTFQASVLPPGRVRLTQDRGRIRSERLAMYDAINGMSFQRLQESLRVIYGLDIYQDFNRAQVVYEYPNQSAINSARMARTPIREALQGELRLGDRYVYWMEIAQPPGGKAFTGQMTVFLKADLDKLESELRNR